MDPSPPDWSPPIVRTVATQNQGVDELWRNVERHRQYLEQSGELHRRRKRRVEREIVGIAENRLRAQVLSPKLATTEFETMIEQAAERKMDPYQVVERVVPRSSEVGK